SRAGGNNLRPVVVGGGDDRVDVGGGIVVGVGVVGRRDGDRVSERAGGRGVDGGEHRVGDVGAREQAGDGVAQRAGDVAPAVAAPGEGGHAGGGGHRVADGDVGGRARPVVGHHDGVGRARARHHAADAVALGDADVVLQRQRVGVAGGVVV